MSVHRNHLANWVLILHIACVAGCAATRPFTSLVSMRRPARDAAVVTSRQASASTVATTSRTSSAVRPVAYDDLRPSDSQRDHERRDDPVHMPPSLADPFNNTEEMAFDSAYRSMRLDDFESLALSNNPTIQELIATTRKAAGFRTQVNLRPNPTLGYDATQLADAGTDQHTFFISQTIITADKLELNRRVLNEALRAQLMHLEAQKYRVVTDIRVKFYEAFAAQNRVQLIRDFQSVTDKGVELAELQKQALEGSQLDVVQAKVQKNEIDLSLQQAEVRFAAAFRELTALAGCPEIRPLTLEGNLPQSELPLDWASVAATMIESSPEFHEAQIRVSQARAHLDRQCVQSIPNWDVQLAAGVDNGTNSGLINLQVGAPIPVFNKNQGNIMAARADLYRAAREADRIADSIKARLATVSGDYDSSLAAVTMYANDILPNADEGLRLAESAYQAGETNFVQVLVARRTYFDTNLQFIASQAELAQAKARVEGYVLTGALEPVADGSGDASLRDLTFSQQ